MKIKNNNQNLYKFKAEQAYVRYLQHREEGATKRTAQHRAISDVGINIRKELDAVNHLEKIIKHEAVPSLGMIKRYITKRKKPYNGILRNGRTIYPVMRCAS